MTQPTIRFAFAFLALVSAAAWLRGADAPAQPQAGEVVANLQAAFNGESNAHAKYLAFGTKADEEGYTQVASLFRAAARAEEVHAANHKKVIEAAGAQAKADLQAPEVKSTKENLQAAINGETYELKEMYPAFVKNARTARNASAVRTFNLAMKAEGEHAKLYKEALDNLEQWKGGKKDFFVCSICGWTTTKLPAAKCPSCYEPVEKYEKIN